MGMAMMEVVRGRPPKKWCCWAMDERAMQHSAEGRDGSGPLERLLPFRPPGKRIPAVLLDMDAEVARDRRRDALIVRSSGGLGTGP